MTLNLYLPKEGKGPFPVVFYVHGGSYTGGNKEGQGEMVKELTGRGIAVCAFNYILQPKGIFPQVYWDFYNAGRFLRANAAKYNLDPLRFGAYGLSAGGWLISSATMPSGDHLQSGKSYAVSVSELAQSNWRNRTKRPDEQYAWLKPIHDPAPAWPGEFGGFSALAVDFQYHLGYAGTHSPALQIWVGLGHKPKEFTIATNASARVVLTELTDERSKGQHVHLPPFFRRNDRETAEAIGLDGQERKELGKIVGDFFERELNSPAARAPAPEIFPIPRILTGPTQVTMLAPRGATIHYTTDGTEPTPASSAYKSPFQIQAGTVVKAITTAPDMKPSGIHTANFVQGPPPPVVTGPDKLPDGQTGKPYSVTFTADRSKVRWMMNGDLAPTIEENGTVSRIQNGMSMGRETGIWSGTSTQPGNFWLQVWVTEGPGMVAGYRNYRWTVTGQPIEKATVSVDAEDRNVELAVLKGWPADKAKALLDGFAKAKLRMVSPDQAGDAQMMLVVHADDRAKATALLKEFVKGVPKQLADGVSWLE